jgi:hypothetical protein
MEKLLAAGLRPMLLLTRRTATNAMPAPSRRKKSCVSSFFR